MPKILKNVPGAAFADFTPEDVVRHPLVQQIVKAYEEYEKKGNRTGKVAARKKKL